MCGVFSRKYKRNDSSFLIDLLRHPLQKVLIYKILKYANYEHFTAAKSKLFQTVNTCILPKVPEEYEVYPAICISDMRELCTF